MTLRARLVHNPSAGGGRSAGCCQRSSVGVEVEVYRTSSLRYVGAVLAELVLARPAGFQLGPGRPRAPDQCLAVHLDGEPAGTVPASFEVVAGAITVLAAPGAPAFRRIPSAP